MRVDHRDIKLPIGDLELVGSLATPDAAAGLVVFAHGSASTRHSPRNRHVAALLNARGLATLLVDLLTTKEQRIDELDTTLHDDVAMLSERLVAATDSVIAGGWTRGLPVGYFGGSTGAAAALIAAARRPAQIAAVVSRGGRLELATAALAGVHAPTLLIVGGADTSVVHANREAAARMTAAHQLAIIPGASHLFEEPGALDVVARLAGAWFVDHFGLARVRQAS